MCSFLSVLCYGPSYLTQINKLNENEIARQFANEAYLLVGLSCSKEEITRVTRAFRSPRTDTYHSEEMLIRLMNASTLRVVCCRGILTLTSYRPGAGETYRCQFDGGTNSGGSTSVRGRVRSPHIFCYYTVFVLLTSDVQCSLQ